MKLNTIPVILMILTSAMAIPMGLSYAQTNGTMTNQTSSNGTMAMPGNETSMSNHTMTMPSNSTGMMMNQTMTNSTTQANDTGAMEISTFIHKAVTDFAKQGTDTKQVIFDCRDKVQAAAPADVDGIKQGCATQINAITAQYQDERAHYHDLIKQYRSSVMVFLHDARGESVPQTAMAGAISQLSMMMMHPATPVTGQAATINNTHCVNPPGGPAIC